MKLDGHQGIVRTVCFNPADDLMLLSGGVNDADLKVWDSQTGQNISNLKGHQGNINTIKMSQDGTLAASAGTDRTIKVWDVRKQTCITSFDAGKYSEINDICFKGVDEMRSVKSSKSMLASFGITAIAAHNDGSMTFWDMNTRKAITKQQQHEGECRSVSFD